jgi:hypothetical protein
MARPPGMSAKRAQVKPKTARIKTEYIVTFRLEVEQDDTGSDKPFDVENSIRVDLESLKGNAGSRCGHVRYLDVTEVGAEIADHE